MENLQLIDFSTEDDFLVSCPGRDSLGSFRLSVTMDDIDEQKNFNEFVNAKKADMFDRATNSRDSLAWDSAFFTNAGVLDPEELFTMNKGFEKPEVRKRKSTYSEYMFDTDGFLLESYRDYEHDLFEDVRASIRKSSTWTDIHSEDHKQKAHLSKKLEYMPQNLVKYIPTSRKQSIYKQRSEINHKGTGSPFISQLHETNGKSKPFSPRPPKISGRVNVTSSSSTRNFPSYVDNAKLQHKSTTSSSSKGLVSSKKSRLGNSSSSTGSSRVISSSLSFNNNSDSISYSSPFSSASSLRSSSNSIIKSNSRKSTLSSSVSTFKTPLKCSLQVQPEVETLSSSTHLSSFSNHSSYYSTASTNDECSLHSPSASYTNVDRNLNPKDRNDDGSKETARGFRPSGLKPPSPKIGFFDKEHSRAHFQFHIGSQSKIEVTTKKKSRDSPLVTSKARELSISSSAICDHTQRKPAKGNISPKLRLLKLKKKDSTPLRESCVKTQNVTYGRQCDLRSSMSIEKKRIKADLESRIEKERIRYAHLSTIVPRMSKNKPPSRKSKENEKENLKANIEDNVASLSKYFEGINLKNEHSTTTISKPRARMPLAEFNSK